MTYRSFDPATRCYTDAVRAGILIRSHLIIGARGALLFGAVGASSIHGPSTKCCAYAAASFDAELNADIGGPS